MNKKMSKRQRDLKSKLMAAICMLLVSSIMMVSTTYAWFTLSTAPEVTGITTAVGANGNLEMALLPTVANLSLDNLDNTIQSSTGDSMDAAGRLLKEANVTWGNLVDLQDNNTYGLDRITLYPAALNVGGDLNTNTAITAGSIIGSSPLGRPVYGADGRVASLKADTIAATYASGAFSVENTYGVRAIGTSSNMSARELEHRSLLSQANSNTNSAKSLASGSLESHGATLAGLAIRKVNAKEGENVKVSATEVAALQEIADSLNTAMTKIELALRYYAAANAIAAASDSDYVTIKDTILASTTALSSIPTSYPAAVPSSYSTKYTAAVTALAAEQSNVGSAKKELDKLSGEVTWAVVETHLNKLVNTGTIQINGVAANNAMNQVQDILDYLLDNGGIHLTMATGSGAFATIADFCGDYSTFITLPAGSAISNGTLSADLSGRQAVMQTGTTVIPAYLVGMESGKTAFSGSGASTTKAISDYYGYIIDLAFRTNAANSNLLLQTAAENRIYDGNEANEAVMGHGSSMTFISGDEKFSETSMKDLMNAIRVVFFDTATNAVIAEARLDTVHARVDGGQVTADLFMYKDNTLQAENAPITALDQNKAKAVSVLVYLDGHSVTNKDVAATGSASMTGSMNLQFASSANLKPMDYTDLMQGEGSGSGAAATTVALTAANVDDATAAQNISVRTARYVESGSEKYVGVILGGNLPANPVVTIKVGDAEPVTAAAKTISGISGYAINVSSEVAADTVVTVSVTAGEAPSTEYTVANSLPSGVTSDGQAKATKGSAYSFNLTNITEKVYAVSYAVEGGTGGTLDDLAVKGADSDTVQNYTIPASAVTGNITITVTEKS